MINVKEYKGPSHIRITDEQFFYFFKKAGFVRDDSTLRWKRAPRDDDTPEMKRFYFFPLMHNPDEEGLISKIGMCGRGGRIYEKYLYILAWPMPGGKNWCICQYCDDEWTHPLCYVDKKDCLNDVEFYKLCGDNEHIMSIRGYL